MEKQICALLACHLYFLAYNVIAGGTRLEDIELQRQDEAWLDALGAP